MNATDLLQGKRVLRAQQKLIDSYKYKTILVTGACGSIGHALYNHLLNHLENVDGVDIDEYGVSKDPSIMLGDFIDVPLKQYDYIFHCAAYKHVKLGEINKVAFSKNNIWKTEQLCKEAKGKVVLISTDKVSGNSWLGNTKKQAEQVVIGHGGIVIRLVNVAFSRGSVLDIWRKTEVKRCCPGQVTRYWMQMEDAIEAILIAGLKESGIYTINDPPKFEMREIKEAWCRVFGATPFDSAPLGKGEAESEELCTETEMLQPEGQLAKVLQSQQDWQIGIMKNF